AGAPQYTPSTLPNQESFSPGERRGGRGGRKRDPQTRGRGPVAGSLLAQTTLGGALRLPVRQPKPPTAPLPVRGKPLFPLTHPFPPKPRVGNPRIGRIRV